MSKMDEFASQMTTQGSGGGKVFPQKVVLKKNEPNPIRIVDMPDGLERFFISWILCDDDKKRPFILENSFEGKSLFMQMLGDRDLFYKGGILETEKDPITQKGVCKYQSKNPELFVRMLYNGDISGGEGSWKPRETYIFNAIQRTPDVSPEGAQTFWCKENRHTKLLEMGPQGFKSLNDVRCNDGDLSTYDVNYMKKGQGQNTTHSVLKAGNAVPYTVTGFLSDEEKAYARYDLKEECKLTKAADFLKYLRNSISEIGNLLGKDWIALFEDQARKESASVPSTEASQPIQDSGPTCSQEAVSSEKEVAQPARRVPTRTPVSAESQVQTTDLIECGYCKEKIAKDSKTCPKCSQTLIEPCVKCNFPLSVFAEVCPSCGEVYKLS